MKKFRHLLLICLLFFFTDYVYSQNTFKRVYTDFNGATANLSCKPFNNDKSFLISGFSGNSLTLLKINSIGNIISTKQFGWLGIDCNFLFNNDTSLSFYSNYWINKDLVKLDTSLSIISSIQYDSIEFYQFGSSNVICPTFNNGFLLSGCKDTLVPVIVKVDSLHNVLWSKYFTLIQGSIQDIAQTQDSGFVIAANLKTSAASLIKTDKNGNVLWSKSYFRPRGYVHSMVENNDGTIILTGSLDSIEAPDSYLHTSPLFIAKIDQNGNIIWAKDFNQLSYGIRTVPSKIRNTQDSGYIILATIAKPNDNDYLLLIKTDANGDTLWCRAHGSDSAAIYSFSVEPLNDKGYIITAVTNNNIPVWTSLYLVRTDSLGHTANLCEEYSLPIAVNNITVNDSNINTTSVPFTVTTSTVNTSTQSFTTNGYDGCVLDNIKELMAEQTAPLLIYPNPATNTVTIEITQAAVGSMQEAVCKIEICNLLGEEVYSTTNYKPSTTNNIDVSAFPNGVYVVQVKTEKGISVEKFIKE